jgi:hypothetical protein
MSAVLDECPKCGSGVIWNDPSYWDETDVHIVMSCEDEDCDREWTEIYTHAASQYTGADGQTVTA